jgi:hypothetical protein
VTGVSSDLPAPETTPAPLRKPEEVIADYLGEFVGVDQSEAYEHPSAQVLIRWLRDEGWQITPIAT